MVEDDTVGEVLEGDDEFELDTDIDESEDLEAAMQDALEAVEKAKESSRLAADEEPGQEVPGISISNGSDTENLEAELAVLRDKSARTLADFENYRKRIDRERSEERRYAAFDVLRDLLDIVDNLERALAADGGTDELKTGVQLILKQTLDLLRGAGVERVEAVGEEFDPRLHEAVTKEESPETSVPTVAAELQPGYVMHERLLRPAIVKVAMPVKGKTSQPDDADTGQNDRS